MAQLYFLCIAILEVIIYYIVVYIFAFELHG
jgi:hypothetical protein